MQLRKQGHCAYKCEYHLVIVTKYRRKIFQEGSFRYFCEIMKGVICEGMPEVILLEVNRVESSLAETPSHTTVQAMSHTAVLDLYFTNSSRRENKPIPLNHFKFSAL